MSGAESLAALLEALPAEARAPVARVLERMRHDVSTPLSTLAMEVFSARMLLDRLAPSTREARSFHGGDALAQLEEICGNIERVSSHLIEYIMVVQRFEALQRAQTPRAPEGP